MEGQYKKQIITTIATALITIAIFAGLSYFYSQMSVREAKVKDAKTQLATYEQNKKVFAEENVELKDIEARAAKLEGYKITLEHVPQLLSSLEGLASQKNVSFEISTVDTPKEGETDKPLAITFVAGGSYDGIESFLNTILGQSYQARIVGLRFVKNQATNAGQGNVVDHPAWEADATIEILSF